MKKCRIDDVSRAVLDQLAGVRFREYENRPGMMWYYAENRVYYLKSSERAGYYVVTANSPDDALERYDRFIAKKPRVLTMAELTVWKNTPVDDRDPVFVEWYAAREDAEGGYYVRHADEVIMAVKSGLCRCWDARPTMKQRQAVQWEGLGNDQGE